MNSMRNTLCALLIVLALAAISVVAAAPDPNNPTGSAGLIMIDKRGGYVRFFDPSTNFGVQIEALDPRADDGMPGIIPEKLSASKTEASPDGPTVVSLDAFRRK